MKRFDWVTLYFDGACLPFNPGGVASYGYAIISDEVLYRGKGIAAEKGTNNVAEYTALIKGLEKALELGISKLIVRGDSQLVIYQMVGIYAVRSKRILPLWEKANDLAKKFKTIRFEWVPRDRNRIADDLSTQAYLEFVERKSIERSREIEDREIQHIKGSLFRVRSYEVDVERKTCTCPHYKRLNSYQLLRRHGIVVRCKHIIAAEVRASF